MPRLAVIQAEGAAPFYEYMHARRRVPRGRESRDTGDSDPHRRPGVLAQGAARDPLDNGVVEKVTEQEIADAKAMIGQCGIGCEPASAATLAGIRKLTAAGSDRADADVVAVLTGNVLKDPDYIYRYHTNALKAPDGSQIERQVRQSSGGCPER